MKRTTLVIILLAVMIVSCLALTACHTCEFGEWTVVKQATCTETGLQQKVCECGESRSEVIPATGHSYKAVVTNPTCLEQGYTTHTCSGCGDSYVDTYVDAIGHSSGSNICANCGETLYSIGLEYTLSDDGTSYIVSDIGSCTDIDVIIPATYKEKPVTSIGDQAFINCTSLTSITIPSSVTSIGARAFHSCSGLTSITIPSSVTSIGDGPFVGCSGLTNIEVDTNNPNYKSIDGNLYTKDGKTLIAYAIGKTDTSFAIPNSVTSIGWGAFSGCSNLTSITIPESVTSIGWAAFHSCSGLTSITIPESVTSIGSSAFYWCTSLTSITIPESITSISSSAFFCCSSLTNITIPDSVTYIGDSAFSGCNSLITVYYTGTQEQWKNISIDSFFNSNLTNASIVYNYKPE